jgi:hypothetical protein
MNIKDFHVAIIIYATIIFAYLFIGLVNAQEYSGSGALDDPIATHSTVTTNGGMTNTIKQPPPSAISPQFSSGYNSDLCTIGIAGAVQTQILGISAGTTFTEDNCLRLKNAKTMYDMGMKVAAVSIMCQDKGVFDSMMHAGTPCPYDGMIGADAKLGWESHVEETRKELEESDGISIETTSIISTLGLIGTILLF